jgi:hypothetical protein
MNNGGTQNFVPYKETVISNSRSGRMRNRIRSWSVSQSRFLSRHGGIIHSNYFGQVCEPDRTLKNLYLLETIKREVEVLYRPEIG